MDDDFIKKRLERDMAELKRLCEDHFAKRREDDAKMEELKERIVTTKAVSNLYVPSDEIPRTFQENNISKLI